MLSLSCLKMLKNENEFVLPYSVDAGYLYAEGQIADSTANLFFSITKDRSGLLKGGSIKLLEETVKQNEWLLNITQPAISELQRGLGYEGNTWAFICALFDTTCISPSTVEQRNDRLYVTTDLQEFI